MSLIDLHDDRRLTQRLVEGAAGLLSRRSSRRGFLFRSALVGSALAVDPIGYAVKPGTAYASVCGTGSTCSSGWTAFCCTVNGGRNECPPGHLVGGWWKADNSGFCCGKARYYVDCHGACTKCRTGCSSGRFCNRECVNCKSGCAQTSTCDKRRYCTNYFRYGQCRQDVSCMGPVSCRVVTCTPPWQVSGWGCSTRTATDNRTASHSAPCLKPQNCTSTSAIQRKYDALGGARVLGKATTPERSLPDGGRYRDYEKGSIYWSSATGARVMYGAIRARYKAAGAQAVLGYPLSDERRNADGIGRFIHLNRNASIFWTPDTGAREIRGPILDRYRALNHERGLGYPTGSPQQGAGGGQFQHFTKTATIGWSSATGAWETKGPIRTRWRALGADKTLGYPRGAQRAGVSGRGLLQHFGPEATILWSSATNAWDVRGPIRQRYANLRWDAGDLGFPRSTQRPTSDGAGLYNDFAGGTIVWTPATGAREVIGPIHALWHSLGREGGILGVPRTFQVTTADKRGRITHFSKDALVVWTAETGARWLAGRIRAKWITSGADAGVLGYPVRHQAPVGDGRGFFADFAPTGTTPSRSVYWTPTTGAWAVLTELRTAWLERGGPTGALGYPRGDEVAAEGGRQQRFEGGILHRDGATGVVEVRPA